jgi:phosphohistidine swiveling domain-containing protein
MDLKKLRHDDWNSYFSGRWSVLSASYWGITYAKQPFSKLADRFVSDTVLVCKETNGLSGYFRSSQTDTFSQELADSIKSDPNAVAYICDNLKSKADNFLAFVDEYIGKDISLAKYLEFQETLEDYYIFHIQNKYAPEKMTAEMLEEYFPLFESARVHAEPVFMRSEELMRELAKIHASKTGDEPGLILSMVDKEFHEYLKEGTMPDKRLLKDRHINTALVTQNHNTEAITGSQFKEVEELLKKKKVSTISGTIAYPGKVEGIARIVFDPTKADHFREGEVLVTKMTRPDYLPLMKKAIAFVTDGGGVLCHAAIVARELKKPCLIGTQVATEQIKDGDRIVVDADKGTITTVK